MYQLAPQARLRRRAVQERQGDQRRAADRGHRPRVQPRHVDHRLYGPEPRAPEAAPAELAHLRRHQPQGQRRPGGRRLLRPALALLGHAGDEPPGHAQSLRHLQDRCRRAACRSGPASAWSAMGSACWRTTPGPRVPRSTRATPSSPRRSSSSSAGGTTSPTPRSRRPRARTGRPTSQAVSSGSPSSMAAPPSATARPAAWSGPSRTRCPSTASRSTPAAAIWWRSTPPTRTARASTGCRPATPRSRPRTTRGTSP